jgi:hypothetical protein
MLRKNDAVQWALGAPELDPVEVSLYGCATVFGCLAMGMQIKGCGHQD